MKREHVVLALVVVIIVLIFLVSVGLSRGDERADPSDSDGIESLQNALRSLPGLGNTLDADEVDADCFSRTTLEFEIGETGRCRFRIDDGIDRLRLDLVEGSCDVEIANQPNTFDQVLPTAEWEERRLDTSLVGEGGRITIEKGPCVVRLDP